MPYQRARELVNAAVPQHVEAWAAILGLGSTDVRYAQFQEDVTEALHACMRAHIAAPYRFRWSDIRPDFMRVAQEARSVASHLGNLRDLPPATVWLRNPEPMFKHLPLQSLSDLEALANEADQQAEACKLSDKGSRPEMLAFATLVAVLAQALGHATDDAPVGSVGLVVLVDAVLPVARDIAKRQQGGAFKSPIREKLVRNTSRGCRHTGYRSLQR